MSDQPKGLIYSINAVIIALTLVGLALYLRPGLSASAQSPTPTPTETFISRQNSAHC